MDASYFMPYMSSLTQNNALLFYHLGQSLSDHYEMKNLVNELHQVIATLNGEKFILLGHSFGSALALEYLKQYNPSSLLGLIFISWIYDSNWQGICSPELQKTIEEVKNIDFSKDTPDEALKKQYLAYSKHYFNKKCLAKGTGLLNKVQYNAKLQDKIEKDYFLSFDCREMLRKIEAPVLSILGQEDPIVTADYIRNAYPLIKTLTSVEISDSCHFPFIEFNNLTLEKINKFLNNFEKSPHSRKAANSQEVSCEDIP